MKKIKTFNQLFENTLGNQKYPNVVTFGEGDYEKFSKYIDLIDSSGGDMFMNFKIKKDKSTFDSITEDFYLSLVNDNDLIAWYYNTDKSLPADKIKTPENIRLSWTLKNEKYLKAVETKKLPIFVIKNYNDPEWDELKTIMWLSTFDNNIGLIEKAIKNCFKGDEFKIMSRIRKYSPNLANQLGTASNDMADLGDLGF